MIAKTIQGIAKAPFIQTSTAEKHDTHPMYNPKTPDNHPVR